MNCSLFEGTVFLPEKSTDRQDDTGITQTTTRPTLQECNTQRGGCQLSIVNCQL